MVFGCERWIEARAKSRELHDDNDGGTWRGKWILLARGKQMLTAIADRWWRTGGWQMVRAARARR